MSLPSSLKMKSKVEDKPEISLPSSMKKKEVPESDEKYQTEEETERNIDRAKARSFAQIGETVLGAPGDIANFFLGLFGKEQNILPGSSKLKEYAEKGSKGYLKANTDFEKGADEFLSDVTSMSLPGTGPYKFVKNIGVPIVGTMVKEGLKYNNASEKAQAYGKVGSMVTLDLLSRRFGGGVKEYAGSLFKKADQSMPKGVSFDASKLSKSLDDLEKTFKMGGSRPTTKKALEKVLEIKNEIKNNKIDGKNLSAYRPSINEAIEEMGGFSIDVPRKLKPQAIHNLNKVKGEVIKTLEDYGKKFNPEYLKNSQNANEAWAAYSKSNKIANFIQKKIGYSPKSKAVQALFSLSPYATAGAIGALSLPTAAGAGIALTGYQAFKVLERIRTSKVLSKYYQNVLKEASVGNIALTEKNLKALDENLKDDKE
jgi:hypothetical protein